MKEEKVIMYDSPEAAQPITLSGWVTGGDRKLFYQDEATARYVGCTHKLCECGNIRSKYYTLCEECRLKAAFARYDALPYVEYKGQPTFSWDGDIFFFDVDSIIEHMLEQEIDTISLLVGAENHFHFLNADYWAGEMPEDGDFPPELIKAIENLNNVIKTLPVQSYSPGKIRTSYNLEPDDKITTEDLNNL